MILPKYSSIAKELVTSLWVISLPSQKLLWKAERPFAFQAYQETPKIRNKMLTFFLPIQRYTCHMKWSPFLTMQALVSFLSWSFLTTAKASWMLASMNSSEDPFYIFRNLRNHVLHIQINLFYSQDILCLIIRFHQRITLIVAY